MEFPHQYNTTKKKNNSAWYTPMTVYMTTLTLVGSMNPGRFSFFMADKLGVVTFNDFRILNTNLRFSFNKTMSEHYYYYTKFQYKHTIGLGPFLNMKANA